MTVRTASSAVLLVALVAPVAAQPGVFLGQPAGLGQSAGLGQPVAGPLEDLSRQIAAREEKIRQAGEEKARLEIEIAELVARTEAAQEELRRRARALYRMRRAGMLPIAGGFDALLSHLSRLERLERMVRSDLSAIAFLRSRRQALRGEVARKEEEASEARRELAQLQQRKQTLEQQLWAQRTYAGLFDPAYAPRLPVTVPGGRPAPAPAVPSYGLTVRGAEPTSGFAQLRGRLRLPVAGGAVREAQREDGRGLEFVSPGASVVAAADGRVAFSQRYGGYGTLVILDHGDDYYTLYGGLVQTPLVPGEWVGEGARVGVLGSQPLFFAVKRGTRSLDARSWVGL